MKGIVILGGGTGGTLAANRLRRSFDEHAAEIVVVDHGDDHVYQPGLRFVPLGLTSMQRIVRPRCQQFRSHRNPAREPLHLPAKPASTPARPRARDTGR